MSGILNFISGPLIMGILNVTPDSFYDGGKYETMEKAVERAYEIEREGADIIDIGGESSRPGASPVSESEEIDRVCSVIAKINDTINIPISVDTYKSRVAEEALKLGALIINDISAMTIDGNMSSIVARYNAYIVLMHMQGRPETMQLNPAYDNLIEEIKSFLMERADVALRAGISKDKIILDPGIGFGKTMEHNYEILANLNALREIDYPILAGISRKSMIAKLYTENTDRLPATLALNTIALINGTDIIRVHDVLEHKNALLAVKKYLAGLSNSGRTVSENI